MLKQNVLTCPAVENNNVARDGAVGRRVRARGSDDREEKLFLMSLIRL